METEKTEKDDHDNNDHNDHDKNEYRIDQVQNQNRYQSLPTLENETELHSTNELPYDQLKDMV